MKPQKPVVIEYFYGEDAPIYSKWSFESFKELLGEEKVGIFNDEIRSDEKSYKKPDEYMAFGEYIDLIKNNPTLKRIFLFNPFRHKPQLYNDFKFPDFVDKKLRRLPFLFFGGRTSVTRIHQDMDMSNVFLTELEGKKDVILFPPTASKLLYRYPMGVHSSVNVTDPDFEKYPGLKEVVGHRCELKKGETLFMPSGYWHHIEYLEPSFGISIRSLSPNLGLRTKGIANVVFLTHLDELMRFVLGEKWFKIKTKIAHRRANREIKKLQG